MSKLQQAIQKLNRDREQQPAATESTASDFETRSKPIARTGNFVPNKSVSLELDQLVRSGLVAPEEAAATIAEQFRAVKRPLIDVARLGESTSEPLSNVLLVSSAQAGDGKTFSTFNLALSISREKDIPVLVIDGDVLSPKLSDALGAANAPGLIDYLNNPTDPVDNFMIDLADFGITFLPAGTQSMHAHELLASRKMTALMQELSERHPGMILIDAPPLLGTNEARILAKNAGQVLLVVAAGVTQQSSVVEAASLIDNSKPLNVLLNKQSGSISRYANYGGGGRS